MGIIEENPFEKGFSSNSFPKTFSIKFPPDISHSEGKPEISHLSDKYDMSGGNFSIKSLCRGCGANFLQKGSPTKYS